MTLVTAIAGNGTLANFLRFIVIMTSIGLGAWRTGRRTRDTDPSARLDRIEKKLDSHIRDHLIETRLNRHNRKGHR